MNRSLRSKTKDQRSKNGSLITVTVLAACLLLSACKPTTTNEKHQTKTHCVKEASLPVKYAKGFSVDYYNGFKVVSVKDVKNGAVVAQYVLFPKGKSAPVDFATAVLIDTPVQKVICISTTHVAELKRLGLLEHVGGVTNLPLFYDKELVEKVKSGTIADLGQHEMNYEKLLSLNPAFVFTDGGYDGGDKMKAKLDALKVKSVLNLDYMEQNPLARAEWLKFIGAFFDKEYEADSIFSTIETNYTALQQKAKNVSTEPTVFCNLPFKEVWYMPCGDNYMAQLIADAGGNFLWKNDTIANGLNLSLDYEAVYAKAASADYWINPGFAHSLKDIKQMDSKNVNFGAYKNNKVYNNNLRNTAADGFDFWESGTVSPDVILADLIYIFHPELLPNHQLYYYQKLK